MAMDPTYFDRCLIVFPVLILLVSGGGYQYAAQIKNFKEVFLMGFGGGGGGYGGAPYFDGSFILFLVLILLVFGTGYGGGCYGEKK